MKTTFGFCGCANVGAAAAKTSEANKQTQRIQFISTSRPLRIAAEEKWCLAHMRVTRRARSAQSICCHSLRLTKSHWRKSTALEVTPPFHAGGVAPISRVEGDYTKV